MPRLFALDSSIVIILAGGTSNEPRAQERAEGILSEHEDSGEIIGIPAAGWAECCHCNVQASTSFMVWPLNAAAAILANRLTPPLLEAGKTKGLTRRDVKLDALILATAEIVGCVGTVHNRRMVREGRAARRLAGANPAATSRQANASPASQARTIAAGMRSAVGTLETNLR